VAAALDLVRRFRPVGYPLTRDAAEIMTTMVPTDDGPALAELGITLRPTAETLEDTFRWLVAAGHLRPGLAGRLA
jgi:dihydroflavonol-4-reductase